MVMMEMGNTLEEMDNKKILIVGNGFDLAHNLKTRYSDVLEVFKKRKSFYGLYINRKIDTGFDEKIADNIPKALESYDSKNLEKLDKIIRNNSWVEYYSGCGAELDLWIDFERELVPVLDIFDFILSADINFEDGSIEFERNSFFKFNCYFSRYFTILNNKIFVKNYYIDSSYGLMKKTLLRDLKNEFLEFIEALEIYFYEFVEKASDVHPISQIREIEPDYIISFNYTHTEKYYGINNVHHIHGVIRDDLDCGSNNMVLGVNDYDNKDFIYFVKYFQRIQKHCGVDYKYIINEPCIFKSSDEFDKEYNDYELYIYGHSLDETDKDVLKFAIGVFDDKNQFQMKARKVIIYYYDQQDFELKVINLITLFGRDIVEKNMDDNKIIFIKIDSNID